jgi:hypothetical protein
LPRKSLIIKVFQRSKGLNFTNGTWNNFFGGAKSLFLLIILLLLYIYIGYVPAFQRFCRMLGKMKLWVSILIFFNDARGEGEANGVFLFYPTHFGICLERWNRTV